MKDLIPQETIESKILLLRGKKVMLDTDLAALYRVETKQLKRAVKRNIDRFPDDFMFELAREEYQLLRRHFGTLKRGAHSKYLPYAFTEQGVAMLSSVLNSKRAIHVNIQIMRTFTRLRQYLVSHEDLRRKIETVEKKSLQHDRLIYEIFTLIKKMIDPPKLPEKPKGKMGFRP